MHMNEFEALIHSLGEHAVSYLGRDALVGLYAFGDAVDQAAQIEIYLKNNSWDEQARAIDAMIRLRELFFDDLAIQYRFAEVDSETVDAARARGSLYALA